MVTVQRLHRTFGVDLERSRGRPAEASSRRPRFRVRRFEYKARPSTVELATCRHGAQGPSRYEIADKVAIITLDRPERLNS